MSHLIQIFLPFNVGDARQMIEAVESELLDRFGGVTLNINSPAKGLWDSGAGVERDKIIVVEIMTEELDLGCWHNYRQQFERTFDQDEILIRAAQVSQL
ncbi:hypothetical protein [Rhizobium sp.]|uniref:hypothetical protein n=1 Tax=Rhizobium sp. TaxID=391 RepID=UPI0028AC8796